MSTTFELDPARPDAWSEGIVAAAGALESGGLVVLPTETVYGIACRPDLSEATGRLFAAKQRPGTLNLPILAATTDAAWLVGERSREALALAERFWPGPLTLVLQRTERSRPWQLGELADSVGVRVPSHAIATALLERTGPLAMTSANLSGQPPRSDRTLLEATFVDTVAVILVLPAGAPPPTGASSTVVDLTSFAARLLREGPIGRDRLAEALPSHGHLITGEPPTA